METIIKRDKAVEHKTVGFEHPALSARDKIKKRILQKYETNITGAVTLKQTVNRCMVLMAELLDDGTITIERYVGDKQSA